MNRLPLRNIPLTCFGPCLIGVFLLAAVFLSGCSDPEPYRESRFLMGTLVDVVLYTDKETAPQASEQAYESIARIENEAHPSYESSPLYKVRNGYGAGFKGDLAGILDTAMKVARATSGAFDPTLGKVVSLWGFGLDTPTLPDPGEIQAALVGAGYSRVPAGKCCPEGLDVWFDLGGVAKGHAVDDAVRVLAEAGVNAGIVNAGGDLRSFGKRPRAGLSNKGFWKIGVQDPNNPQELAGVLEIKEAAVATSGDYQRFFEEGGIRYHHILDPSTGYPARAGLKGTTVVATDCATADALATAAFVMGPEKGLALVEEWKGAEGVLIKEDGTILTTSGIGEGGIRFEERND